MIDNSRLVVEFVPEEDDTDTFLRTEIVDRSKERPEFSARYKRAFYHRSKAEFLAQLPEIRAACEVGNCRAWTRLAPRSFTTVGHEFARLVTEATVSREWRSMRRLYDSACGKVGPVARIWLLDVDRITPTTDGLATRLSFAGLLRARIPSRKGEHLIVTPHDPRRFAPSSIGWREFGEVEFHKDNPTNLFIPDGAA